MVTKEQVENESLVHQRVAKEERFREKVDKDGTRWTKVYCGGRAHCRNWLS